MKHVTFTRDMLPIRAGEQRVLPDDVAARMESEGAVAPNAPDWPPQPAADPKPFALTEPEPEPERAERRSRRYLTK